MINLQQILIKATQELSASSPSPRLDAEILLAHFLQKDRTYLYTYPEKTLSDLQVQAFEASITLRKQGMPIAYISGQREFWSLPLKVTSATLIPRPETELLVETALHLSLPTHAKILDLGTGTGAIALALAKEKPLWEITAIEQSTDALAVAQDNATHLGIKNIHFIQSNWFSALNSKHCFNLIVTNPPYIAPNDPHLHQGDVRFEPQSALVSNEQGLADLHHLIMQASNYLSNEGWLIVEHGYDQKIAVNHFFQHYGYSHLNCFKDHNGQDRLSLGQYLFDDK